MWHQYAQSQTPPSGAKHAPGLVHARAQVFLALCLRLAVALTNYERGDNLESTIITVCEVFCDTLFLYAFDHIAVWQDDFFYNSSGCRPQNL